MKISEFKNIIREEVRKIIKEDISITNWNEYVNPDYIKLTLSNGKKLKIAKQQIKGGKAVYQSILTLLDSMESNPKAKAAMLTLVTAMVSSLNAEK